MLNHTSAPEGLCYCSPNIRSDCRGGVTSIHDLVVKAYLSHGSGRSAYLSCEPFMVDHLESNLLDELVDQLRS